jgi:3-oxoacyl-[acyl-carrier protein] reductase
LWPLAGEQKVDTEIEAKPRQHAPGMRFQAVNALFTGAGRGFGSLIAVALAKEGANVVVTYNNSKEGADKISEQIKSLGASQLLPRQTLRSGQK